MFMFSKPDNTTSYPVYGTVDPPVQFGVQIFIVLVAIICVPWMLLAKPLCLRFKHRGYKPVSFR